MARLGLPAPHDCIQRLVAPRDVQSLHPLALYEPRPYLPAAVDKLQRAALNERRTHFFQGWAEVLVDRVEFHSAHATQREAVGGDVRD